MRPLMVPVAYNSSVQVIYQTCLPFRGGSSVFGSHGAHHLCLDAMMLIVYTFYDPIYAPERSREIAR
jgi:hypothetical protein